MFSSLLKELLPLWVSVVRTYAESTQLFADDRALRDEKHRSAAELVKELELYLPEDDLIKRQRNQEKTLAKRRLRLLKEIENNINRPLSAQSLTPVTPLYLTRANSNIATPSTEASTQVNVSGVDNGLLGEIQSIFEEEIFKVKTIRKNHNNHPAGSYDFVLEILRQNIDFTIINARCFSSGGKVEHANKGLLTIVTYLSMLEFDRLIAVSLLPRAKKYQYCLGSGFCMVSTSQDDFLNLRSKLLSVASEIQDQNLVRELNGDIIRNQDLNRYCHYSDIVKCLDTLSKPPRKIIEQLQTVMMEIKDKYKLMPGLGFEQALNDFITNFYNYSPFRKIGQVIDQILSRRSISIVMPSPNSSPYAGGMYFSTKPTSSVPTLVVNSDDSSDTIETDSPVSPSPKLKFPMLNQ